LSLNDWINEFYLDLLENEWKMNDIDDMDIYYYLNLLLYKTNKEHKKDVESILAIL